MTLYPTPSAPPYSGEPEISVPPTATQIDPSSGPSNVPTATAFVDATPYNGPVIPVMSDPVPFSQSLNNDQYNPNPNLQASPLPGYYNTNGNLAGSPPQPFQIEPYNGSASAGVPMHLQTKLGSKCCGCCCDFRRAVIILNVIFMVWSSLTLLNLVFAPAEIQYLESSSTAVTEEEEAENAALTQILKDLYLAESIIGGIGLAAAVVPLYGAYAFRWGFVAFGIIWLIATLAAGIVLVEWGLQRAAEVMNTPMPSPITTYIIDVMVTALFIYPHAGLVIEIYQGIMTAETLPREDFSICCTPQPTYPQQQIQQQRPTAIAYPIERDV